MASEGGLVWSCRSSWQPVVSEVNLVTKRHLTVLKFNELKGIRIYATQVGTENSVGNFFRIVDFFKKRRGESIFTL